MKLKNLSDATLKNYVKIKTKKQKRNQRRRQQTYVGCKIRDYVMMREHEIYTVKCMERGGNRWNKWNKQNVAMLVS